MFYFKWIYFTLLSNLFNKGLTTNMLPPLPEEWSLELEAIEFGIKNNHWLKDYTFYAPSMVKPNSNWNAYVVATWSGPTISEENLLKYIKLEFRPMEQSVMNQWSGDKTLDVASFDHVSNKIIFRPKNNKTFMIAPHNRTGIFNGMYFNLAVSGKLVPGMDIKLNTRIFRDVEVTCSDGLFCNGEERFVNGKCLKSNINPCEDDSGDLCSSYECIESEKQCSKMPKGGPACPKCYSDKPGQILTCAEIGYECGWTYDRTLFCGNCSDNQICSKGNCILASDAIKGTCENPIQLLNSSFIIPQDGLTFTIYGDLSDPNLIDSVLPICHYTLVPDIIYVFKIESRVKMGIEVQMLAADGSIDILDTLLALTDENCAALPTYSFCGDDSSPPGGLSSRVFGKLQNGTYKLVASATRLKNLGPFKLMIKFYPNCVPQCDGNRKCGSDGCGGVCGVCPDEQECYFKTGKCRHKNCIPDCFLAMVGNVSQTKQCGDDGCGGLCGSCNLEKSEMCSPQISTCKKIQLCDSLKPVCDSKPPHGMKSPFCANDCKWHDIEERIGDLTPNDRDLVIPSIEFEWQYVSNRSCSVVEGCFRFTGYRLVMRFDTYVHNIGRESFVFQSPEDAPDKFEFSPCHAHYHFEGFASFNLYDMNSKLSAIGGKRGYCVEDTIQTSFGLHVSCKKKYSCEDQGKNQGIQPGYADLYRKDLDCQWIDITYIPKENWYIYEVCTNTQRKIAEASYSNNCKRFPVYIPEIQNDFNGFLVKYSDILKERNITSDRIPFVDPDSMFMFSEHFEEQVEPNLFQSIINFFSYILGLIF